MDKNSFESLLENNEQNNSIQDSLLSFSNGYLPGLFTSQISNHSNSDQNLDYLPSQMIQ